MADAPFKDGLIGKAGWLTGQMLVATPSMQDPRFAKTVIFICTHGPEGAMGIVLNRLFGEMNFRGLLGQLNIALPNGARELPIHFGGPVDPARGFVLHSPDYFREGSAKITDKISLTATVEILQAMAEGGGPEKALLALGYAGWGAGQLEGELQSSVWLIVPSDPEIVFAPRMEAKWDRTLASNGIDPLTLSGDVGHA